MAALSLEAFIRGVEVCPSLAKEPLLMPEAYVALGRIMADKLGRPEAARRVFYEFLVRYPFATQRDLVVNKLRLMTSART